MWRERKKRKKREEQEERAHSQFHNTKVNLHKFPFKVPQYTSTMYLFVNKIELLFLMKFVRTIQIIFIYRKDSKVLDISSGKTVQTEISLLLRNLSV